jgi:hypothetical protein
MESKRNERIMQTMDSLFVIIPPSPLFAAHWSLFILDRRRQNMSSTSVGNNDATTGRRIHVSGDRLNGFKLEIIRRYNITKHRGIGSRRFPIGQISQDNISDISAELERELVDSHPIKDEDEGGGYVDNQPKDDLERICVKIEPPGPSLNHVSDNVSSKGVPTKRPEVRDCQWWVRKVVATLFEAGILRSLSTTGISGEEEEPGQILARLPVH